MYRLHTKEEYENSFELKKEGVSVNKISEKLGIPRSTLVNWFYRGTQPYLSIDRRGTNNPVWKGSKATPQAGRKRARGKYQPPKGYMIHHIDGNPLNNEPENIKFVTRAEHMKLHNIHSIGGKATAGKPRRRRK